MFGKAFLLRINLAVALTAALAGGALSAAPVLASSELGHTGTVGFHALTDNSEQPGARCSYKERAPSTYEWEGELNHVDVRPPKMRAAAGTQKVGWQFIVQRRAFDADLVGGPWRTTHRSSVQTAVTDTNTNASFAQMGVDVVVPTDSADQDPTYFYRVRVKMFWYGDAGNVVGSAKHGVDWFRFVEMDTYSETAYCHGWLAWMI